jgi:Rps23 Pro-64 3,4-dihydroxylase Tpa1-like proline 4-hydroxylase
MKILGNKKIEKNIVVIDNWYNENELKAVWKELDFYSETQNLERASKNLSVTGLDEKGEPQANCYRIYLDDYYKQGKRHISPILRLINKFVDKNMHNEIKTIKMGRQFPETNSDISFVSYYEEGDSFKPHFDVFQFTALIWLYKEPRQFEGGDLILNDFNNEIVEVKNNRLVFFPSYYIHQVEKIKMKTKDKFKGRYSISHFFYTVPSGKI